MGACLLALLFGSEWAQGTARTPGFLAGPVPQDEQVADQGGPELTSEFLQGCLERLRANPGPGERARIERQCQQAAERATEDRLRQQLAEWLPLLNSPLADPVEVELIHKVTRHLLGQDRLGKELASFSLVLAKQLEWQRNFPALGDLLDGLQGLLERSPALAGRFECELLNRRVLLSLRLGLIDVGWHWLERQRAALERIQEDPTEPFLAVAQRAVNAREANLRLARREDRICDERVTAWLADEALYPPGSTDRGTLLRYQGLARLSRSRIDPGQVPAAHSAFEAATRCDLSPRQRRLIELHRVDLALLADDLDRARQGLDRVEQSVKVTPFKETEKELYLVLHSILARRAASVEEQTRLLLGLRQAFDAFLEAWRQMPPRRGGIGFFNFTQYRRIVGQIIDLNLLLSPGPEGVRAAFEQLLEAQAMNSLYRELTGEGHAPDPGPSLSLERLQEDLCPAGHGFLVYHPSPYGSHLFLLDRDSLEHVPLAGSSHLEAHGRRLSAEWPRTERALPSALMSSARALLPPAAVDALGRWTHVTVVGSEHFPTEFLLERLPNGDGQPIGETCAMGYASSLPALHAIAHRPTPTGTEVWWMAHGSPQAWVQEEFGALQDLPMESSEIGELFASFDSARVRGHLGEAASKDRLLGADLGQAAYLHILAHGVSDWRSELPPAIVLHGEGLDQSLLRCEEVLEDVRAPQLVTLSVCSADTGPRRAGESEVPTFSGAFLRAGAACVVLAPERVEYHAMLEAMEIFNDELARGRAPSEALMEVRRQLPETTLPLRAVGMAHRPIFRARRSTLRFAPWTVLGGLAGLFGTLLIWSRTRRRALRSPSS